MPIYEYEHLKKPCSLGRIFDVKQSIRDKLLMQCPNCDGPVRKLISRINISTPKSNSELRDLGFTKLVKRDDGVYENVTARDGDSRMVIRGKSETLPDLKKTIRD
ncbi:MAG: zinc ribbon domain-containing protein [Deltaproteobacteria bacterium]|nr:zinc ribbon domain-containing protein [Deltaproteobacteria bacterium]